MKNHWFHRNFVFPLILLANPLWAGGRASVAGEFLIIPFGERATGMGEIGAALGGEAVGLLWNPASLLRTPQTSVSLGRVPRAEGGAQDYFFVSRAFWGGVAGTGIAAFDHGTVDGSDPEGFPSDTLHPIDRQIVLGYARQFPPFPFVNGLGWGLSVKHISSRLVNQSDTFAFDGGLLSRDYWAGKFRWGMAWSNLGGPLKYNQSKEPLPRTFRIGGLWIPKHRWTVASDLVKHPYESLSSSMGLEYARPMGSSSRLFTRAGLTGMGHRETEWRVGLGFGLKNFRLDYSFQIKNEQEALHGFGLVFEWNERGKGLSPALQSRIDRGRKLIDSGQYPEAILIFHEALKIEPACSEAQMGIEEAYRLMQGR